MSGLWKLEADTGNHSRCGSCRVNRGDAAVRRVCSKPVEAGEGGGGERGLGQETWCSAWQLWWACASPACWEPEEGSWRGVRSGVGLSYPQLCNKPPANQVAYNDRHHFCRQTGSDWAGPQLVWWLVVGPAWWQPSVFPPVPHPYGLGFLPSFPFLLLEATLSSPPPGSSPWLPSKSVWLPFGSHGISNMCHVGCTGTVVKWGLMTTGPRHLLVWRVYLFPWLAPSNCARECWLNKTEPRACVEGLWGEAKTSVPLRKVAQGEGLWAGASAVLAQGLASFTLGL